jgi:hypothetical protein
LAEGDLLDAGLDQSSFSIQMSWQKQGDQFRMNFSVNFLGSRYRTYIGGNIEQFDPEKVPRKKP